jgi:hypothetical protein
MDTIAINMKKTLNVRRIMDWKLSLIQTETNKR